MPNWEYKIITSGTLGFASLQLLEQHLNQLGKEEWEIIHFQTRPDNPLAFHGLARRPVMRDWTVETAPPAGMPGLRSGAIPAPPEEKTVVGPDHDELRAEAEERRESLLAREESLRPLRAEADDDEGDAAEDDDEAADNEDLPTFFEAIRPHMRKNQRGPGMAVGVDFLAKKFEQTGTDLLAALQECGFSIPNGPKDPPAYLEYEGDLYWLNLNHRGQLWINTREKPRPAFKPVPGRKMATAEISETGLAAGAVTKAEDRGLERESRQKEREGPSSEPSGIRSPQSEIAAAAPLPGGAALLGQLRPRMRRNRRGGGLSGSISYLARALKADPKTLEAAFGAMGLVRPAEPGDKPVFVEIDAFVYWLNQDKSGQTWINARERDRRPETGDRQPESPPVELVLAADSKPEAQNPESPGGASPLAAVRLLLKETRRGGLAAEVGRLAKELGKAAGELLAALTNAGLQVPEKAREKPVFVEHAGEIFWLNRNAKGELWLNARASKFADEMEAGKAPEGFSVEEEAAAKKSRRPRKRKDAAGG